MDTPIHEWIVTKQDFLHAQRLHRANRPRAAILYYLWYFVLPVCSFLYLVYFALHWHELMAAHRPSLGGFAGVALYLLILIPIARWFQIRRLWRQSHPEKYQGQPVTFQFDPEMVISARPGESEGRFYWKAIEDYAEDERLALIYVQRKLFLYLPQRAMDEAEWERLRALALPRKRGKESC